MNQFRSVLVILVLWIAGLCAAAQFAKVGLFLPELQLLYPEAGAASGFLITLISLVGALLGLVAGMLVGQIGARRVLLTGLVIGGLISLVQSFGLSLNALLATRVVEGISHLAIVVAAPTLMAQHSSVRMLPTVMTLWGTFFGVSFALTAWLGLPLVSTHGIHTLFLTHASALGIITVLVFLSVRERVEKPAEKQSGIKLSSLYSRHKSAWLSPFIAAPATGWLFYTTTFVALLAILPAIVPAEQRALVSGAMPLASIFSSITLGAALLWRYSAVQVTSFGFVAAIGFATLFLIKPPTAIFCLLLFSALGIVQGASFAAIPQLNKTTSDQALAYGAIAQAGNIGNLCGTPLLLAILNVGGTQPMILFVIACYIAAIVFHYIFSKRRALASSTLPDTAL